MSPSEIISTYPDVEGYVYFIRDYGLVKIGFSRDPFNRMYSAASNEAQMVHVIATSQPRLLESRLHSRFADKQQSGEWFDLGSAELGMIRKVSFVESPDDLPDDLQPADPSITIDRRKKIKGVGRYSDREGQKLFVYLKPDIHKGMMEFIDSYRPRITKTAFIETVLEQYLRSVDCWED